MHMAKQPLQTLEPKRLQSQRAYRIANKKSPKMTGT